MTVVNSAPARTVLLYGLAIAMISGANFIVSPLLLQLLGHDGFAAWSLLEPVVLALLPVAGLGIQIGLLHRLAEEPASRGVVIAALFPFHVGTSVLVGAAGACMALAFGAPIETAALLFGVVTVEALMVFFISVWRARNEPGLYALLEAGRAVAVVIVLAAILAITSSASLTTDGYLSIRLLLSGLAVLAAVVVMRPKFHPDWNEFTRAFRYGAPIVLASMMAAILANMDRYALDSADGPLLAGYVVHTKLAQLLLPAAAAFYMWYAPRAMQHLNQGEAAHPFFVESTSLFYFVLVGICANAWFLAELLWPFLFPSVTFDRPLFALLLMGTAFYAMGNPLSLGTLRSGKTHHATLLTIIATLVAAAACFALAPQLGTEGAAIGRMLGMGAYTVFFATHTIRTLGVRYPVVAYVLLGVGAAGVCVVIDSMLPWDLVVMKLALVNLLIGSAFIPWRRFVTQRYIS